jgi:hypothetical protein
MTEHYKLVNTEDLVTLFEKLLVCKQSLRINSFLRTPRGYALGEVPRRWNGSTNVSHSLRELPTFFAVLKAILYLQKRGNLELQGFWTLSIVRNSRY